MTLNLKVWLKAKAADRALLPLRREVIAQIDQNATLLEIGCGTGDLLFQAAPKISLGYGVDIDQGMIDYAQSRKQEAGIDHLTFECFDASRMRHQAVDVATSTLCLHELPEGTACEILRSMIDNARVTLIADYTAARRLRGGLGIELDEMLSGHYRNFRRYRQRGGIPAYVARIGAVIRAETRSVIDGISIWRIGKRETS